MNTLTDRKRVQKYIVIVNYVKKFVACCLPNPSVIVLILKEIYRILTL